VHKIRPNSLDIAFENAILSLLAQRKLICGQAAVVTCEDAEAELRKEATEKMEGDDGIGRPSRTRERCRQAARRLASRGDVIVTQNGKIVDPSFAKGVMELKLPS
jgi:hypothetical protein